jgi:oligopeptide/dipeptide ABC transporter ATP-binding protein
MIEARDIVRQFPAPGSRPFGPPRQVHAVNGVSVDVPGSGVLAIVGESGCGKTTLGRILAGLTPPTAGTLRIDGQDPAALPGRERDELLKSVQYIHQDPYSALNPNRTIWQTMAPILRYHHVVPRGREKARAGELLEQVGLVPDDVLDRYPHQLSGGQRQRTVLARALIVAPRYLVTDEAVSMIDVSLRVGILDLLRGLVAQGIGVAFITHDFGVARYVARDGNFVVMYLGRVIEQGATDEVIFHPSHPYTRMLISAVPDPDPAAQARERLLPKSFEVPSPIDLPLGCAFAPRCPFAVEACLAEPPALTLRPGSTHPVACILPGEAAPTVVAGAAAVLEPQA